MTEILKFGEWKEQQNQQFAWATPKRKIIIRNDGRFFRLGLFVEFLGIVVDKYTVSIISFYDDMIHVNVKHQDLETGEITILKIEANQIL